MVFRRFCWSLHTHGIQVERQNLRELSSVLAMVKILSSGNCGSAFSVRIPSEGTRELHGVVRDQAVAEVIQNEGVADPGSRKGGGTRRKGVPGNGGSVVLLCMF